MNAMDDRQRGLYGKYKRIERHDGGTDPGGKHEDCRYFVLDWAHDPFAIPAMKAYAEAARKEYPLLAEDIDKMIEFYEAKE